MPDGTQAFTSSSVHWAQVEGARVAYRKLGRGPNLVLLHGWPLSGATFRKVLPYLTSACTCYVLDLPGGGQSEWSAATDFSWPGQAQTVRDVLEEVGLESYLVLGQDSGGVIARHLAALDPERVTGLILTNTEVPGHRPPWIPTYRRLMALPGTNRVFRCLLRSRWFLRSPLGFGPAFQDKDLALGTFYDQIVHPLVQDANRMAGHNRFLRGWDWALLDRMEQLHASLEIPVHLVWGADDRVLPIRLGHELGSQFPNFLGLEAVAGARTFVQEENPREVARGVLRVLWGQAP